MVDWMYSEDESLRFDALALVHDFRILPARHALEELLSRLSFSTEPSAPFEAVKAKRVLQELMHVRSEGIVTVCKP